MKATETLGRALRRGGSNGCHQNGLPPLPNLTAPIRMVSAAALSHADPLGKQSLLMIQDYKSDQLLPQLETESSSVSLSPTRAPFADCSLPPPVSLGGGLGGDTTESDSSGWQDFLTEEYRLPENMP